MTVTAERIEGTMVDIQAALSRVNQYQREQEEKYQALVKQTSERIQQLEESHADKVQELEQAKVAAAQAAELAAFAHGQYRADVAGLQSSLDVARAAVDELINRLEIRTGRAERAEYERRWPWLRDLQKTRPQVSADPPADEKLTDAELVQLNKAFRQSKQEVKQNDAQSLFNRLSEDLQTAVSANKVFYDRNKELIEENEKLRERVDEVKATNESLASDLGRDAGRLANVQEENMNLRSLVEYAVSEIVERLDQLEKRLAEDDWDQKYLNVCRDAAAIITSLRRERAEARAENAKLRVCNKNLQEQVVNKESRIQQLAQAKHDLVKHGVNERNDLRAKRAELETKLTEYEGAVKSLKEELTRANIIINVATKIASGHVASIPEPEHELWIVLLEQQDKLRQLRDLRDRMTRALS